MQILFQMVMPDEPATIKRSIVLRRRDNAEFAVHWQDVEYAAAHGEGTGYQQGFYPPDIKTAVAELVRRLEPVLKYHKQRAVDLEGIVRLTIAVVTLTYALSQDASEVFAIVDRLNHQLNQTETGEKQNHVYN